MNNDPHEYTEAVLCTIETPKAIFVVSTETKGARGFWVPKSVIHDDSEVYEEGGTGKLVVKTWFAEKEGWE